MANTVVGFSINIDGVQSIDQLNQAIRDTEKSLKGLTVGTEEYTKTAEKLAKFKAEQAAVKKQQDDLNKSFLEQSNALGAYDKASAKLNRLRKDFKNLAFEGKGASKEAEALRKEIEQLDKELKDTDASVGQFQRNVGNYPDTFFSARTALVKFIPGLEDINNKFKESGVSSSAFSVALIGAFAAIQAGQAIVKIIGDLNKFNKELDRTQQQLTALTGLSGEDLNGLQTDIMALAKTFEVDSKTIIDSAKQISDKTGVSFKEAIGQIENGLLKGNESAEDFLSGIAEFPEAYATASDASGKFADKQRLLLETNKELADNQEEAARKFESVGAVFERVGNQIQTFLIDYFLFLYYKVLEPFYNTTLKPLIKAFEDLFSQIGGGSVVMDSFIAIIRVAMFPLTSLLKGIELITKGLSNLIYYAKQAGQFIGILSKENENAAKSTKDYFAETTKGITDAFKLAEELEAKRIKQEQDAINARKKQADAIAKANEEAKKQAEQLAKDRQKFLDDENKFTEAALKINQNIIEKTNSIITNLISDEYEKRRQIAKQNEAKEIEGIQNTLTEQKKANQERLNEALKLYDKNSKEVKALNEFIATEEAKEKQSAANFEKKIQEQTAKEIEKINKEQSDKLIELKKKEFDTIKTVEQRNYDNQRNLLEKSYNEQLKAAGDNAKEIEKINAQYQNDLFQLEKQRIQDEIDLNTYKVNTIEGLNQDEKDTILSQNIKLNADLAKLDADRTKNAIEEGKKRSDANNEQLQKDIDTAGQYTQLALDTVSGLIQAGDEARMKRLEKDAEANAQIQSDLEERLQSATGLERRYLEQQLQANKQNAEAIAKAQEEAEREAAKKSKIIAIIQSIINTALAVTKQLAIGNVAGAVLAGITGGAQTAVIAAQPLAKGGVVGKGDDIVQFANGGRVTSRGNIKPLSNGDNVLATLKTGEIVLNESQQRRIGYASLKRAQIPNFANGGLVGAPTSLISNANNSIASEQMRVNLMDEMVKATNQRIDRLTVVYTATTDYEVEKGRNDKKTIKANSTF
jgi:hypothetical protein